MDTLTLLLAVCTCVFCLLYLFEREEVKYWRQHSNDYQANYHRAIAENVNTLRLWQKRQESQQEKEQASQYQRHRKMLS